jgi:hypothetical protein
VISPNLIFQGNLSIGNKWDEALANKSTPVYQQKADNFSKLVRSLKKKFLIVKL